MLKSIVSILKCAVCETDTVLSLYVFNEGNHEHVKDGVIQCESCKTIFPIENDLLEFIHPDLIYKKDFENFLTKFSNELSNLKIELPKIAKPSDFFEQEKQRNHYDNWADSETQSYDDFEEMTFWKANDELLYAKWESKQKNKEGWMIDVGCGNGRSAVRLSSAELTVIGFDISKSMVRKAINRSKDSNFYAKRTFIVGDANKICFKDNTFHYAITSGVLSQLPNVNQTCNEIQRVLNPQGIFFGLENNKSLFRIIFDLLYSVLSAWKNEKGKEPEISKKMLVEWHNQHKVKISSSTTVYLPPVVFNFFSVKLAKSLILFSDFCFKIIGLKNHGGLITFEIEKQ